MKQLEGRKHINNGNIIKPVVLLQHNSAVKVAKHCGKDPTLGI